MLDDLSAERVRIAFVCICKGYDSRVILVDLCIVRSGRTCLAVHRIYNILRLDSEIAEEYVVELLRVECVESELPALTEFLIETDVHAGYLRILEVSVHGVDCRTCSRCLKNTCLNDILIRIACKREIRSILGRIIQSHTLGLHTCIVVSIRHPHERHAAGEKTCASTEKRLVSVIDEPTESHSWRPED